jgi:hypothetical protein
METSPQFPDLVTLIALSCIDDRLPTASLTLKRRSNPDDDERNTEQIAARTLGVIGAGPVCSIKVLLHGTRLAC